MSTTLGSSETFVSNSKLRSLQHGEQSAAMDARGTVIINADLTAVLDGLRPWSNYTLTLAAATVVGRGVTSMPLLCTTEEDGELNRSKVNLMIDIIICFNDKGLTNHCEKYVTEFKFKNF